MHNTCKVAYNKSIPKYVNNTCFNSNIIFLAIKLNVTRECEKLTLNGFRVSMKYAELLPVLFKATFTISPFSRS